MATLPSSLALTNIADGANIVADDHRNNYSAIQTEANALLTLLGGGAAGQILAGVGTTLSWVYPPGYELAYVEFTSPVAVSGTSETVSPNDVVSAGAVTFDGTACWFEFWCPYVTPNSTTSADVFAAFYDGTTSQGKAILVENGTSPGVAMCPGWMRRKLVPSAGSHTFKVSAWEASGAGSIGAGLGGAGNYLPGYIRITKA